MPDTARYQKFDRDTALDTAMRVFWQHGYDGTSLKLLLKTMGGVSAASLYSAFKSKERLYLDALNRYLETHGKVFAPLHDLGLLPRERVLRALRASARMQTERSHPLGCMITLATSVGSPRTNNIREASEKVRCSNRAALMAAVQSAIESGALRSGAVEGGLAALLDLVLNGMSVAARDGASPTTMDSAVDAAMLAWDSWRA